jgi:hypothetical protein
MDLIMRLEEVADKLNKATALEMFNGFKKQKIVAPRREVDKRHLEGIKVN